MRPEDIQGRDFLVGLRGYDKEEVRSFLAEVATAHAAALSELSAARDLPAPAPAPVRDDFENLGASVAAILRAAKESAAEITGEAEGKATEIREGAARYAETVRRQADEAGASVQESIDTARAQADQIVREATERARQAELEHTARVANQLDEARRREAAMRARLHEAAEEVQLALVALGDEVDLRDEEQVSA